MNESGIIPVDDRVVVRPEKLEETTDGGIVIPETVRERHDMGHIKAQIVAIGPQSFEDIDNPKYHPQEGQNVLIAKYAGYLATGKDGEEYRIINGKDVVAILDGEWKVRPSGG